MKTKKRIIIYICAAVLLILGVACAVYLGDYYPADPRAEAVTVSAGITVETNKDGTMCFIPETYEVGWIFYPGGKVEYTAYIPLMTACAEKGILCILTEMPFHLAVLDINAAEGLAESYPAVTQWYIGGHSLGGSMAASYLGKHSSEFEGLILLASYSATDLSAEQLKVLSVFGSEDGVLDFEKYEANKANLPAEFTEAVIQGGNHAGFGLYGSQDGDGTAAIGNEEQIVQTAEHIAEFVKQ